MTPDPLPFLRPRSIHQRSIMSHSGNFPRYANQCSDESPGWPTAGFRFGSPKTPRDPAFLWEVADFDLTSSTNPQDPCCRVIVGDLDSQPRSPETEVRGGSKARAFLILKLDRLVSHAQPVACSVNTVTTDEPPPCSSADFLALALHAPPSSRRWS